MGGVCSYSSLQSLYEAAREVVDNGGSPQLLRKPLEELDEMVQFRESAEGQDVLELSRNLYDICNCDNDREVTIDDATVVYHNETNGYWVMGWCFVSTSEDEEDKDENDEDEEDGDQPIHTGENPPTAKTE